MNKFIYILPALVLGWLGYLHFSKPAEEIITPQIISMKIPDFSFKEISLTQKKTNRIITSKTLPHKVMMITVFASWCGVCSQEHPQLITLAQEHNLSIYGIAYNDTQKALINYFRYNENPYEKIALTPTIYNLNKLEIRGTPESFLIDANGMIRYRHRGPILKQHIEDIILPIIKEISQ
ncbi:MAG: hypothetical protein COB36_04010 [Alphaproteobacteria bacterium]|nr:MAG: hypothetical protein COB36_04010 [Alphaproteobacteria bacterium]